MLRNFAEKSDAIRFLEIVGSEINSASCVRDLMADVETSFNSSFEIASFVVLVKVPCNWTMWRLLAAPTESPNAEMFNPVMLTKSPSAACEAGAGTNMGPKRIMSEKTRVVVRARARRFLLIFGENLNP
jgi:hypothetical protein